MRKFDPEVAELLAGLHYCVAEGDWSETTQSGLRYLHQVNAGLYGLQDRGRDWLKQAARARTRRPRHAPKAAAPKLDLQVVK